MIESYQVPFDLLASGSAPPQELRLVFVLKACYVTQLITLPFLRKKRRLNPRCVRKFVSIAARCFYIKYILSSIGWESDSVYNLFCCRSRLQKKSNAMFISDLLLRWYNSCWCVNWRGFERLDASHGLEVSSEDVSSSCVARPQQPSVSVLFDVTFAVLLVDPVACMCCLYVLHPLSLNYFLLADFARPQPPSVSLLFAVAAAVLSVGSVACICCPSSATARLSVVCCRRSFPLRGSCCFHVLPVPSHRPSLMENHALTVSLGGDGRDR